MISCNEFPVDEITPEFIEEMKKFKGEKIMFDLDLFDAMVETYLAEIRIDEPDVELVVKNKIKKLREDLEELERIKNNHKWCKDCKEYDKENHCCHRFSYFTGVMYNENLKAMEEENTKLKQTLKELLDLFDGIRTFDSKHYTGKTFIIKLTSAEIDKYYKLLKELYDE